MRRRSTRPLPKDWAARRRQVLARDLLCTAAKCIRPSLHVDHIVPRSLGGDDALTNLQGRCGPCHARKTYQEQVDPFGAINGDLA